MNVTVLDATRGDHNIYDFDITGDIDAADLIWFRAARRVVDLTDAAALIQKSRGAGIVDVDAPAGKFQVQLAPADTVGLADEALSFHVVVRKADVGIDTSVARGLIRF